jgi:hypothetical protein
MLFTRVKHNHNFTIKKIVHVKFNRLAEVIHVWIRLERRRRWEWDRHHIARGTPFISWLRQIHVYVGQQQRSSNSTRVLILFKKKKNSITIKQQFLTWQNKNYRSQVKLQNPSEQMLQRNLKLTSFSKVQFPQMK